jgi:hypothetical protein
LGNAVQKEKLQLKQFLRILPTVQKNKTTKQATVLEEAKALARAQAEAETKISF